MHIIWFVTLILLIVEIKCNEKEKNIPDLTLLSKKNDFNQIEYICAAGKNIENSAITFITNVNELSETPVSIYRKSNSETNSDIDCDFESNSNCNQLWQAPIHNIESSEFLNVAPVIDERWQKFKTFYLHPKKYINYNLTAEEKSVSVSIRTRNGASILLCASNNFVCYWIVISNNNINDTIPRSSVSICNNINFNNIQKETCTEEMYEKNFQEIILDENKWQHFTINIDKTITLLQFEPKEIKEKKLIEFKNSLNITINNLIFLQEELSGLWKIHHYNYLKIDIFRNAIYELGPILTPDLDNTICIAFYALTCSNCEIEFSLDSTTIILQGNSSQLWQTWKYVKISIKPPLGDYRLKVKNLRKDQVGYVAIDDIRRCKHSEVRIIKMSSNIADTGLVSCQSLRHPTFSSMILGGMVESIGPNICENNRNIGMNCKISCKTVTGNSFCNKYSICKASEQQYPICTCAAGFTGIYCEKGCDLGTYSYSCKKKCEKPCVGFCRMTNGECDNKTSCSDTENRTNDGCVEPVLPFLLEAPILIKSTINSITVRLQNVKSRGRKSAAAFKIEFKEANVYDWISTTNKYELSTDIHVNITNLKPFTIYNIRAVLYTNDDKSNEETVFTNIKTICQNVNKKKIQDTKIDQRPKRLTINWTPICDGYLNIEIFCTSDVEFCPKINYKQDILTGNMNILGLTPLMEYKLIIRDYNEFKNILFNTTFTTDFGELPRLATPPIIVNTTLHSFAVKFYDDQIKGVKIAMYYEIQMKKKTETNWFKYKNNKVVNGENIENVINLNTNTTYLIRIVLYTNEDTSDTNNIPYVTTSTDDCKNASYFIENLKIDTFETYAKISWIPICNNQFIFHVKCDKIVEWCEEPTEKNQKQVKSVLKNYILVGLTSFSQYNLSITNGEKNIISTNFKTKPSAEQTAVKNLTVYSRDNNSISIRWKRPQINDAVLYQRFYYKCTENILNNRYNNIETDEDCKSIWPKWICNTITETTPSDCYRIYIRGFYETLNMSGVNKSIEINGIKNTETPRNIKFNQKNSEFCWQHPDFTRGKLRKYIINIKQNNTNLINKKFQTLTIKNNIDTQQLNYCYTLDSRLEQSSTYEISVQVKSDEDFSNSNYLEVITEPVTPELKGDVSVGARTTTTQEINIPEMAANTLTLNSLMYVQICNETMKEKKLDNKLANLVNCSGESWTAAKLNDLERKHCIIIGDSSKFGDEINENITIENKALDPLESYTLKVILINEYMGQESHKVYTVKLSIPETMNTNWNLLYVLLPLLLLFIVAVFIAFFFYKKKQRREMSTTSLLGLTVLSNRNVLPVNRHDKNLTLQETNQNSPLLKNEASPKKVFNKFTHVVKISSLSQYVKKSLENGELQRQHGLFEKGGTKPWTYGMRKENKFKNRYNNLTAYDHSRVILEKIGNDPFSDFINANYIDGYKQTNAYIATQGPKLNTINDFWRMIWQENVQYIVMLANLTEGGKKKCEQYWPEIGTTREFINISVTYLKSDIYADFEYRTFEIQNGQNKRLIQQLHFTSWPDHGVPLYPQSLVPFLKKIQSAPLNEAPIVVHCSAGVGRTGTIILADICLRMAASEGQIDALKYLHGIRSQRANMVDNFNQYKLVHMILLEYLLAPETNIQCDEEMAEKIENLIETGSFRKQLDYLENTAWHNKAMSTTTENHPENVSKNRFPLIIPGSTRIYISRYPFSDENSDYINAIPVDGFRIKEQFIVTQNPLPNTVKDFWRMVHEHNCKVIVSLNSFDPNDKSCNIFWPTGCNEDMKPMPHFIIKYQSEINFDYYNVYKIQLINENAEEGTDASSIKIIQFKNWKRDSHLPQCSKSLICLFEEAQSLSRDGNPMIVTCFDGATACGIFVALSFVIEKIKLEQICDVCLATRVVRCNREQFIINWDQFVFLYKSALEYVNSFDEYANFQGPAIRNY